MSMKSILLGTFGIMIVALITISAISYSGLSTSAHCVLDIQKTNGVVEKITTSKKDVLKLIAYANAILVLKNNATVKEYQSVLKNTKTDIDALKNESDEKEFQSSLKKLSDNIEHFGVLFASNDQEKAIKLKQLEKNSYSLLDSIQQKAFAMHNKLIEQNKQSSFHYESIVSIIALIAIAIAIILAFVVYSFIIKNLLTIQNAARDLSSSDGDLTKRIPIIGKNEIGKLAE